MTYRSYDEVATSIISDDRIKVSDIVTRLRETTIEASRGIKPISVKYCAIHTGFKEQKTDDQDAMKQCTRDMFARCPTKLERILMAYHMRDASLQRSLSISYVVVILKYEGTFNAYYPDVPGCVATSSDLDKVRESIVQGLKLHLSFLAKRGVAWPVPCEEVEFDPKDDVIETGTVTVSVD